MHTQIPSLKQALTRLIEIPSISSVLPTLDSSNLAVINELAFWFENAGFKCEINFLEDKRKANLIAVLGKGPGGLILAGHTDTVPCDEALWRHSPFKLSEHNNRFYGLGVCDMKGFFALIIEALKSYQNRCPKSPLIILATADEETSMNGAKALAQHNILHGRKAIIGEPTSMKPIYIHKGIMLERLSITGHSGHSSDPSLGNNAMEAACKMLNDIMVFRAELSEQYQNPGFTIPTPTLNLGCIHGGDNPNRICGQCTIDFDIRTLPGMDSHYIRSELDKRLQRIAQQQKVTCSITPLAQSIDPFCSEKTNPLTQLCEKLTGNEAQSVAFATEAPFLQNMNTDTIVLGPGNIEQAHQPNEFLALNRINPMVTILCNLIKKYCF